MVHIHIGHSLISKCRENPFVIPVFDVNFHFFFKVERCH